MDKSLDMKHVSYILSVLTLWIGMTNGLSAQQVDGFAARVNDRLITMSDIVAYVSPVQSQLQDLYSGSELLHELEKAYTNALHRLVDEALIVEEFKAQQGVLPDKLVDERMENVIHDRFAGDTVRFLSALTSQGMSLEEWRTQIRERLIVSLMRNAQVNKQVYVSPTEVKRYYDRHIDDYTQPQEVYLKMIIINKGSSETDTGIKRAEAQSLHEQLQQGQDFAALAKAHSEGSYADKGGDWGWIKPADLRQDLQEALATMKAGDISVPIEGEEEFFILKLDARKQSKVTPFEQVREQIQTRLTEKQFQDLYDAWMQRLRNKHFVHVYDIPGVS